MTTPMEHLIRLCSVTPDRRIGSDGNRVAVAYVEAQLRELGWQPHLQWFDCLDWESDGGEVRVDGTTFDVVPAPYGVGTSTQGRLIAASSNEELGRRDARGAILLLHGPLTSHPLTPRGYPFYSSAEDDRVRQLIEDSGAKAVIAVTGRFPEMCGALEPYPFIEDGTVDIPVASVDTQTGARLLARVGRTAEVALRARRRPSRGANVVAVRGRQDRRVTVVAHIDTKPGTPGALDNGTGVVAVLQVAKALNELTSDLGVGVELLFVNGEDSYCAAGELRYLEEADLDSVVLAVNTDGAGLPGGPTAWSLYGCPPELGRAVRRALSDHPDLVEGSAWIQSDHAVFSMQGRPALALTSSDLATALGSVAHAPTDTPDGVDIGAVDVAADAIVAVVRAMPAATAP